MNISRQQINEMRLDVTQIKDYMMLCLKTHVLLSGDVFEKFRDTCLDYYEINPWYTYSTPRLIWLCGLKYTNVRLKY